LPETKTETRVRRTVSKDRMKTCGICGERVPDDATECPSCGAWLSKDSSRFRR
jgi:predicted nucleic acid-binding Zn ribbon protein